MYELSDQWHNLCKPFNIPRELQEKWFRILDTAYSSKTRFYHNWEHISDVLQCVDDLVCGSIPEPAVQWAVWFHDAVYDSRRNDNEAQSADLAEQAFTEMSLSTILKDEVRRLILLTKHHQPDADDAAEIVLSDADLAILSATPDRYRQYSSDIRREFAWVDDDVYRKGRIAVLQRFLDRPRIYNSPLWQTRNDFAQKNLLDEINQLDRSSRQ